MLLFEELLKGEEEYTSWSRAVEDLGCLLDTETGGMRELMRVVNDPFAPPDTLTNEEVDALSAQIDVVGEMARAYQKGKSRKKEDLEELAKAVGRVFVVQGRRKRSEEVLIDYMTGSTVVRSNKQSSWIRNAYGIEYEVPTELVENESQRPGYTVVDSETGRSLKRDHSIRLITEAYAGKGMPRGLKDMSFSSFQTNLLGA